MNSRTTDRLHRSLLALVLPVIMLMGPGVARAQIVVANPLEWAVLVEGNELIDGQIKSEIEGQTQTAVLQGTIAAEFTQIKNWENKYNAYLKSVDGYDKGRIFSWKGYWDSTFITVHSGRSGTDQG